MRRFTPTLGIVAICRFAGAQCSPEWAPLPGPPLDDEIEALATWDPDGPGPMSPLLLAGGMFQNCGLVPTRFAASWDGAGWTSLGTGLSTTALALKVYSPAPSQLPSPVFGGAFVQAGGSVALGLATWNGLSWNPIGGGVEFPALPPAIVHSLGAYEGSLFVTGSFTRAGGVDVQHIARWDGAAWVRLPDERARLAYAFTVHEGHLYAGGAFESPENNGYAGVLRWTGQSWVSVGTNYPRATVRCLASYQGKLIAGGSFCVACGEGSPGDGVAAFDGAAWGPLGAGIPCCVVHALSVFDADGPGPLPERLIAGGSFTSAGGVPASGVAAWDGASWSALGSTPLGWGVNGVAKALAVYEGQLAVGGLFSHAGSIESPYFALWGCPRGACYANCDGSTSAPALNIADFSCFLLRYSSGEAYANCDASTQAPFLNVADFSCFLVRYAQGCP